MKMFKVQRFIKNNDKRATKDRASSPIKCFIKFCNDILNIFI